MLSQLRQYNNRIMEIVKNRTWVKIPEALEEDVKHLLDNPYFIERVEEGEYITWYGYNTNWQLHNGIWSKLVDGGFDMCEEPEYEKLYQEAIK
jgi:hypothetical protein